MITLKEIIILAKNYGLKNARFMSVDSSKCPIEIRDGECFFKNLCVKDKKISEVSQEEIDRIDEENDYYLPEVFKEMTERNLWDEEK